MPLPATEGFIPFGPYRTWYRLIRSPQRGGTETNPVILLHGGPGVPSDCLEALETLAAAGRPVVVYVSSVAGSQTGPPPPSRGPSMAYAIAYPAGVRSLVLSCTVARSGRGEFERRIDNRPPATVRQGRPSACLGPRGKPRHRICPWTDGALGAFSAAQSSPPTGPRPARLHVGAGVGAPARPSIAFGTRAASRRPVRSGPLGPAAKRASCTPLMNQAMPFSARITPYCWSARGAAPACMARFQRCFTGWRCRKAGQKRTLLPSQRRMLVYRNGRFWSPEAHIHTAQGYPGSPETSCGMVWEENRPVLPPSRDRTACKT